MTEQEFHEAFMGLLNAGVLYVCGYEDGLPLYNKTPEDKLTDEAKAYLNELSKDKTS